MEAACPKQMKATSNGAWQKDNPLDFALPLIILQICLVVAVTRGLALLLRPLRQPRVIAEIIGGILLGPSALGRSGAFSEKVFPVRSLTVLDTLANIGLLFFLFLVGLELDLRAIRRTGKKALAVALAGISLPSCWHRHLLRPPRHRRRWRRPRALPGLHGVALSITAFPVLARILAELKLLTTDVGRMAMSAAAVNDVAAWILLALAVALSGSGSALVSIWVLLSGVAFVVFASAALRPCLAWMARRSRRGAREGDVHLRDACGGAGGGLRDRRHRHPRAVRGLRGGNHRPRLRPLPPPLFRLQRPQDDIATISGARSWGLLLLVILTACLGKIAATVLVSLLLRVPPREALALGFLMNTKGLVELIVLNIGKDRKVLNEETFAILVLMALFTTFITTPIVMAVYKPARRAAPYRHRTVERADARSELRILACFHSTRSIPATINLIESSRGRRRRGGVTVYAIHLMELSERSSAISMVHKARRNGLPFWNNRGLSGGDGDLVVVAFEAYQQLSSVSVRPMTAISDLATIHEDIVTSAQQKRVALIVLPFHKQQRLDGAMESLGSSLQHVNQRVLRHAPCSVAVLVDRGLGGVAQVSSSDVSYSIAVLFFGGRDDREALAYALRMSEHPGIALTVLRFLLAPGNTLTTTSTATPAAADETAADDALLAELRATAAPLAYEEKVVTGKEDIIAAIKAAGRSNLFLVGRSPPLAALCSRPTDCPELGPVGSFMAISEFSTSASVLVIQQHDPKGNLPLLVEEVVAAGDGDDVPDTPDVSSHVRRAGVMPL
ncbi:unnamed protein product [Spirodela intermedia]|uniref:Uncharacterized protein n=1 Tax=Spirodela intermedia TaxID=51605 RepID=A0A7I8JFB2_SPIIN|nr:unnamed protein product [Spirodela intermedia]CAA6668840.1 unnamed protein product [Spirodela intermedia]